MTDGNSTKATLPAGVAVVAEALAGAAPSAIAPVAAAPAPATDPVPPANEPAAPAGHPEDIGTWRYAPWKGIPHWIHTGGETSFDRAYVRALRKMI